MNQYELLALVIAIAIGINLPFGAWRTTTRKFSLSWFLSIHVPIPAIFIIRRAAGFGWDYVPVMIACAVTGQLLGGWLFLRIRRRAAKAEVVATRASDADPQQDARRELHRAQIEAAPTLAADVERIRR
jgi:hypothetical protein